MKFTSGVILFIAGAVVGRLIKVYGENQYLKGKKEATKRTLNIIFGKEQIQRY